MPFIRSISGLRATLGDGLLPTILSNYAAAFDRILPKGNIVISMDGRPSGYWIKDIVAGTLLACGRKVKLLGVTPTPTLQLTVEQSKAVGGIAITASHNPAEWNGLKFINREGIFLDLIENKKLWKAVKFSDYKFTEQNLKIKPDKDKEAITNHIKTILELPLFTLDVLEKIQKKKFKVVVDAVNAAGSKAIPELLKAFGCEVIELFCDGTGLFPHTPEPIRSNLGVLASEVKNNKADIGVAVDPDSDRLALIDENGEFIGEEKTIVLAVEAALSNMDKFIDSNITPYVVVNNSTTQVVDDICKKYGAKIERSAVGEINVVKTMKKNGALIGGEGSGGVILPACHYGRDALVGSALVLYLMATRNATLSELIASFPNYNMVKEKCTFHGDLHKLYSLVVEQFPNGKPIKGDGIKIQFPDGWIQARASNTEPIVRIIAEDPNLREAKKLIKRVKDICVHF